MIALNSKIIAYLKINQISFSVNDFEVIAPLSNITSEEISHWNSNTLGTQPTQSQLDAAWLIFQGQEIAAQNKAEAIQLLSATDWCEMPSVSNTALTPHLTNISDFITYRTQLRAIAVNPSSNTITWPTMPTEQWSS